MEIVPRLAMLYLRYSGSAVPAKVSLLAINPAASGETVAAFGQMSTVIVAGAPCASASRRLLAIRL